MVVGDCERVKIGRRMENLDHQGCGGINVSKTRTQPTNSLDIV